MASASICCSPPESCAAGVVEAPGERGEQLERLGDRGSAPLRVPAVQPRRGPEVLAHGEGREDARPPGTWTMPRRRDHVGRHAADVAPSWLIVPRVGVARPEIARSSGGLAGAVGAEQGDVSPRRTSKLTPKSTCTCP